MNNRPTLFPILWLVVVSLTSAPGALRAAASAADSADLNGTTGSISPPATSRLPTTPTDETGTTPSATNRTEQPTTYTVKHGGTLADVAHKFHCSVAQLKKLNHLTKTRLKPGQTLEIPPSKAEAHPAKHAGLHASKHKAVVTESHGLRAEPVQDFDRSRSDSTASASDDDSTTPAPSGLASESSELRSVPSTDDSSPQIAPLHGSVRSHSTLAKTTPNRTSAQAYQPSVSSSSSRNANRRMFGFFSSAPPPVDWSSRFVRSARDLGDQGISYNEDWRPPGESRSWSMDCSNTTRYLYKVTTGIQLPRTASDQYYYLHIQNKAWDVPQTARGYADCNFLRENLKPGDLLFWENTYKPDRQPPITHVMVFVGTNARGDWLMAGSQTGPGGEHNRRHGGPDIYVFNPNRPCGGYTTWLGFVHHKGRFCAFGRPLEADRNKLAVASND